jgi:ABC-2 type transport system ATP-binding protein
VIAEGAPDELGGAPEALVTFRAPADLDLPPLPPQADVDRRDGRVAFRTATPTRDLAPLLARAAERGVELDGLTVTRPSLEDVYLELTAEERP